MWIIWGILILNHFILDSETKLIAIQNTNKFVSENTQLIWEEQLKKLKKELAEHGNNPRDIKIYNEIENSYYFINEYYKNNKIDFKNLIEILPDSSTVAFKEDQKQQFINTNNQTVKDVYKLNLHQNAYRSLYNEYSKLGYIDCSFSIISIGEESDSTLGFYGVDFPLEMDLPKQTIQFVNQKDNTEKNWQLPLDKNLIKPIIFQINTYTKTDTIKKRYQIKPSKGKKLNSFDYEEIEIR